MTDIVWKLGSGSTLADWELRYSMRSALASLTGMGMAWIIGHVPSWLNRDHPMVRCIPWPDPYKHNKDANLIQKAIRIGMQPELSERFVFTSDDHFFLKPLTYDELGPFYEWDCASKSEKEWEVLMATNTWFKRLNRTYRMCRAKDLPTLNWESHIPMPYSKAGTVELLKWDYGANHGYTVQSLYYNTNRIEGEPIPPGYRAFISDELHPEKAVELFDRCKVLTFTPKGSRGQYASRLLEKLYPDPAPWELDDGGRGRSDMWVEEIRARREALDRILG